MVTALIAAAILAWSVSLILVLTYNAGRQHGKIEAGLDQIKKGLDRKGRKLA